MCLFYQTLKLNKILSLVTVFTHVNKASGGIEKSVYSYKVNNKIIDK